MAAVELERDGSLLVIELNRPSVLNAIDEAMSLELSDALDMLETTTQLRVGVIHGAGSNFCAGMDLREFAGRPEAARHSLDRLVRRTPGKPIVLAVEGAALGGGLELAAWGDMIIAAEGASFGLPEVRASLVPSGGGLLRLPRRMPRGLVMEMALTGLPIPLERLRDSGLVNQVVPAGQALGAACGLGRQVAANPARAVAAIVGLLREAEEPRDWTRNVLAVASINDGPDAREGVQAFLEKRPPAWRRATLGSPSEP